MTNQMKNPEPTKGLNVQINAEGSALLRCMLAQTVLCLKTITNIASCQALARVNMMFFGIQQWMDCRWNGLFVQQMRVLGLLCFWFAEATNADSIKVMMLHNFEQRQVGWKNGFFDFFVPYFNGLGGFQIDTILCEETLSADGGTKVRNCVQAAQSQGVDAIIAGTSSFNAEIKLAAEEYKIPNLHCSGVLVFVLVLVLVVVVVVVVVVAVAIAGGVVVVAVAVVVVWLGIFGFWHIFHHVVFVKMRYKAPFSARNFLGGNPMSWTPATPHAFGMHLPFTAYVQRPIEQAEEMWHETYGFSFSRPLCTVPLFRQWMLWPCVRTKLLWQTE